MPALYSQRIRDAEGDPEVFVYDCFPEAFRNQFFHIVNRVLRSIDNLQENARGYYGSSENVSVSKSIVEKLCEDFGGDIKACSRSGISVNKDTLRI